MRELISEYDVSDNCCSICTVI